jgi:hypothetical protein
VKFSLLTLVLVLVSVPATNCELPNMLDGGGPAGVKDAPVLGGGPAGVVDGFSAISEKVDLPREGCDFASGVAGGLDEKGT